MSICAICIEPFTKQPHKKEAKCPYCDIKACISCTQKYLLETHEDPHCMGCRRGWSREVMDTILLTTWLNDTYKKHRQNILLDRERSRLPAVQIIVERRKLANERTVIRSKIAEEMTALERQLNEKRNEYYLETRRIDAYNRGQDPFANSESSDKAKEERRVFVMPCPAPECRGFLSTAYKCGVCDLYSCPECHELKGLDRDAAHTCDPNTVATVRAMKKDCRNCPDCGTNIFKIEGCFGKDTPVLLWNGSTKLSQDIQIGDILVGDDGKQRNVTHIFNGEDRLYEIQQNKASSYTVNGKHTLVLKNSGDKTIHYNKMTNQWKIHWMDRKTYDRKSKTFNSLQEAEQFRITQLTFSEEIEITVENYINLNKWQKMYLMGYKSNNSIEWNTTSVSLDPYLLGLWLGDGTHSHPIIASNDPEIQNYLVEWCDQNDAELVHDEAVKFRIRRRDGTNHKGNDKSAIGYGSSSSTCTGCKSKPMDICNTLRSTKQIQQSPSDRTNPFLQQLQMYNLLNNKHIPKEYINNSRDIRLKVLAGIIDSDGHVSKEHEGKRVMIIQTEGPIVNDIILLSRSLGFVVNVTKKERTNISIFGGDPKNYKSVYSINLSGDHLNEIPTKILRKQCVSSNPNKDYYRTNIEVIAKDRGTYYGWIVDGNHRFLHEDFTVLRNCNQMFCTNCNTPFDWVSGKKITGGAIHNPHYFEYLRASNNGVMPRNPGDIPCIANLPGPWQFDRELIRRFVGVPVDYTGFLYQSLNVITHIQHVEIPQQTNNAADMDNTEANVKYLQQEYTADRWKQLLQQREKRRMKRDEIRMRYEAFVGACVDIYGRLMVHARQNEKVGRPEILSMTTLCQEAQKQLMSLRTIFNDGMMDLSKRYKCQVLQLGEKNLKREMKKYETGRVRRVKKSDGDMFDSDSSDTESSAGNTNVIVPTTR